MEDCQSEVKNLKKEANLWKKKLKEIERKMKKRSDEINKLKAKAKGDKFKWKQQEDQNISLTESILEIERINCAKEKKIQKAIREYQLEYKSKSEELNEWTRQIESQANLDCETYVKKYESVLKELDRLRIENTGRKRELEASKGNFNKLEKEYSQKFYELNVQLNALSKLYIG